MFRALFRANLALRISHTVVYETLAISLKSTLYKIEIQNTIVIGTNQKCTGLHLPIMEILTVGVLVIFNKQVLFVFAITVI